MKNKGLNELSREFHEFQVEAGFDNPDVTRRLMLVNTEISEAFEAYRKDKYALKKQFETNVEKLPDDNPLWKEQFELLIKDSHEDEIADAIIRLLAYCGENNIDIEWHVENKNKYNKMRGFKYGGKKF